MSKEAEVEVLDPEIRGDSMIEVLRGGAAITKAENETLAQIAITRPRDPAQCLRHAIDELEIDPEFAEKQYYVIPFKNADGSTSNVEGLSIKAAMALARNWGNCTTSARLVDDTDDAFVVEGIVIDLEKGFRVSKVGSISKWYRNKKTKKMVRWREDRLPQLLGAGASKQVRNAILNMIPEPMQRRYWARAKEIASEQIAGKKSKDKKIPATAIKRILDSFKGFGVEREHIEGKLGHTIEAASMDEIGMLAGLRNALLDGSTDAYQAFGVGDPPAEPGSNDGPPVEEKSIGDLFGGKAE
jgi:hypothetical protein